MMYDGEGPAAYFWAGKGPVSSDGIRVPLLPACQNSALTRISGETVRVELPAGKTIKDIDYLSRAAIPVATGSPMCGKKDTFKVQDGWNCETLRKDYQVRWRLNGNSMNIELVAKVKKSYYMGFGVSGRDDKTFMVDSDVVIATDANRDIQAIDYFMNSRGQCVAGNGVCPDTENSAGAGSNNVTQVSGERVEDTLIVRYTRPVGAGNALDRAFKIKRGEKTFVTWATGPFNVELNLPQKHRREMSIPSGDVSFEFGREPINRCETPIVPVKPVEEKAAAGWTRPTFHNVNDFTARIGP
eukprot:IDg10570t1